MSCRNYVREHKNVLKGTQKLYISPIYPTLIVEIGVSSDTHQRSYWLWVFRKDKYSIIRFKKSPSYDVVQNAIKEIREFEK